MPVDFPSTPILDDFNRSDRALGLDGKWWSQIGTVGSELDIVSNTLRVPAGAGTGIGAWVAITSRDQEAYFTIGGYDIANGGTMKAILRADQQNIVSGHAYYLELQSDGSGCTIFSNSLGSQLTIGIITFPGSLAIGDAFGGRIVNDTITVYTRVSGIWGWASGTQSTSTFVDSQFIAPGYCGVIMTSGLSTTTILDNFGGGGLTLASEATGPGKKSQFDPDLYIKAWF